MHTRDVQAFHGGCRTACDLSKALRSLLPDIDQAERPKMPYVLKHEVERARTLLVHKSAVA